MNMNEKIDTIYGNIMAMKNGGESASAFYLKGTYCHLQNSVVTET